MSDPAAARLVESAESAHSDHGRMGGIARALGVTAEPVRIDRQAKYAAGYPRGGPRRDRG